MKQILVADCGGTSCKWIYGNPANGAMPFTTEGFSAAASAAEAIDTSVDHARQILAHGGAAPSEIAFFGAGCGTPQACQRVETALAKVFPKANISVRSDLDGAALATLGHGEGLACILGTGANAGYYRGGHLISRIPPLGYILGDEGSGASIGRRILVKALRGELREDTSELFFKETGLSEAIAIEKVYRTSGANAFLGSLTRFIHAHMDIPELEEIITEAFGSFRAIFVEPYLSGRYSAVREGAPLRIGIAGSVGEVFAPLLRKALEGIETTVTGSPAMAIASFLSK